MDPVSIAVTALVTALVVAVVLSVVLRRDRSAGPVLDPLELRRQVEDASERVTSEAVARLFAMTQEQLRTQGETVDRQARNAQDGVRGIVEPLQQTLADLRRQVSELEQQRAGAYSDLRVRLENTGTVLESLRTTTTELNTAMRRSDVRGHWGELQLQRVIEMAGLKERVSYSAQTQMVGEGAGRPDVTVNLTDGKVLYIDAKAPMGAFFDAIAESDREVQAGHLARHANDLLGHVRELERRAYVADGASLPFMVLFVPNEASLVAALEADPGLLEKAMRRGVALTGPTSLVMMLTNISAAWRQQVLAENAEQIVSQVAELHRRFAKFAEHLETLGKRLEVGVKAYNETVGSFERRLLPIARRVESLASIEQSVIEVGEVTLLPSSLASGASITEPSLELEAGED
jgi:DNA recombination protein RmuC